MRLTDRELATVLAALRHWQDYLAQHRPENTGYEYFYNHDGIDRTPLTPDEIDALIEDKLNVKDEPKAVYVVTYDWRNWSRDIMAFDSREKAEQHVIANANEADASGMDDESEITDFKAAVESLNAADHSVYLDELTILDRDEPAPAPKAPFEYVVNVTCDATLNETWRVRSQRALSEDEVREIFNLHGEEPPDGVTFAFETEESSDEDNRVITHIELDD